MLIEIIQISLIVLAVFSTVCIGICFSFENKHRDSFPKTLILIWEGVLTVSLVLLLGTTIISYYLKTGGQ